MLANHITGFIVSWNWNFSINSFGAQWHARRAYNLTLMSIKITGIQLFLILLTVVVHAMGSITLLLTIFHRINLYLVDLSNIRIFENQSWIWLDEPIEMYDSSNPGFDIEYSNIQIRPSQNSVHCIALKTSSFAPVWMVVKEDEVSLLKQPSHKRLFL